jgi:hypothetical protein
MKIDFISCSETQPFTIDGSTMPDIAQPLFGAQKVAILWE